MGRSDLRETDGCGCASHRRFEPLLQQTIGAGDWAIAIPPVLEVLEFSDRKQFDVIVVNTPGPMGWCGVLAAKMLRVPVVAACHLDVEKAVLSCTNGDYRLSEAARGLSRWLYQRAARVVVKSRAGRAAVAGLGIANERIALAAPAEPAKRPVGLSDHQEIWLKTKVRAPRRLICSVGIGSGADGELLAAVFELVCQKRSDVALVFTEDTPWVRGVMKRLKGLPVQVVPARGEKLATLYCSGDLLVHPHRDDVSGQTAVDALALGLPAIVGDRGAAVEFVEDQVSGGVLAGEQPLAWADAIVQLLYDEAQRRRMSRNAPQRIARHAPGQDLKALWEVCHRAVAVAAQADASEADRPLTHKKAARVGAGIVNEAESRV